MGCKHSATLNGVMEVFDRRPSDREPVECRCAATDLIKYDQRTIARLIKNRGCLDHLDHECRAAAGQIIGSADPRENPVNNPDMRTAPPV